jgi:hypothetical protein
MSEKPSTPLTMTPEDLKNLVSAAVASAVETARKPLPPTEEEVKRANQKKANRAAQGKLVLREIETRRNEQQICTHKHGARDMYKSHCVFVRDGNYVLCQKCLGKIRPTVPEKERFDKQAIYDTALFNQVFQECYDEQ